MALYRSPPGLLCVQGQAKLMKQCVAGGGLLWLLHVVNSYAARQFHIHETSELHSVVLSVTAFLSLHFWPGIELQLLLVNCWSGSDTTVTNKSPPLNIHLAFNRRLNMMIKKKTISYYIVYKW